MATISKSSKSKVVIVPKPPVSGTQDGETSKSTSTKTEEAPIERVEETPAKKEDTKTTAKATEVKND